MRPVVIGVAGRTGSGKTTVVREIVSRLGPEDVAVVQHDSYYRDRCGIDPAALALFDELEISPGTKGLLVH